MGFKLNISEVNALSEEDFKIKFENIVECYPKTAEVLFSKVPFKKTSEILDAAQDFLDKLVPEDKELVLKLHPDLAGKLADEGKLTSESTNEQKSAGLDKLTTLEKNELNELNKRYKHKFGFPFVICARENKADAILNGLRIRMINEKHQELLTGIEEVKKICKLRLQDIIL